MSRFAFQPRTPWKMTLEEFKAGCEETIRQMNEQAKDPNSEISKLRQTALSQEQLWMPFPADHIKDLVHANGMEAGSRWSDNREQAYKSMQPGDVMLRISLPRDANGRPVGSQTYNSEDDGTGDRHARVSVPVASKDIQVESTLGGRVSHIPLESHYNRMLLLEQQQAHKQEQESAGRNWFSNLFRDKG